MSSDQPPKDTDAELEAFRRQWRAEVQSRNNQQRSEAAPPVRQHKIPPLSSSAPKPRPHHKHDEHEEEDVASQVYYDLPDKEADFRVDALEQVIARGALTKEPQSALEHYEKAVEKETMGSLGDSVALYRTAFKMDDRVHEKYKNKHFPPSAFPPKPKSAVQQQQQPNPSNASQTVPGTAHHSSHGLPPTLSELVDQFSQLSIPGAPAPTDADPPPPCPIADLPGEILSDILTWAAVNDLASLAKVALVCKRFAFLVMTDEAIWKRVAQGPEFGFAGMHYNYVCNLKGEPVSPHLDDDAAYLSEGQDIDADEEQQIITPPRPSKTTPEIDNTLLHSLYSSSWRQMFRSRPRLRFNGCYISTVNYQRPGATNTNSSTWGTPILIVTYFRYLRFFRDGSCISLLTTTEPIDVVHHLTKENLRSYATGSLLPNSVMKDALRGRWRLSGPGNDADTEAEGDVHIETDGVIPKYMWKMQFALGSRGKKSAGGNKLSWKGFWSYNRLTDDWGEFALKNDKAFLFSRVRGYGMGY
ncbi:hypothetical protein E4T47_07962 [Aureobasidium subglaciale]|nr:hypothetical protein E4T47_07962 [Aureobasidium subglaciale]